MTDDQQQLIAKAISLGRDLEALRAEQGLKSRERAVIVRSLSRVYKMTQRDIAAAMSISNPRVSEIINGPKKRKKT